MSDELPRWIRIGVSAYEHLWVATSERGAGRERAEQGKAACGYIFQLGFAHRGSSPPILPRCPRCEATCVDEGDHVHFEVE